MVFDLLRSMRTTQTGFSGFCHSHSKGSNGGGGGPDTLLLHMFHSLARGRKEGRKESRDVRPVRIHSVECQNVEEGRYYF